MRILNILRFYLTQNRALTAWEIHQKKQLMRKIAYALIVLFYLAVGVLIYLYETGGLDYTVPIVQVENGKVVQVELKEVALKPEPVILPPVKGDSSLFINSKQYNSPMMDDKLQEAEIVDPPIEHIEEPTTQTNTTETCGILVEMPKMKKQLPNSTSYWYAPTIDIDYANRIRNNYTGCVLEHLEQPYASVALAVSAICAYHQGGPKDFNFLGEEVWGVRKFSNAGEYFEEFSQVYNPAKIEDMYFDQYQGKDITLVEQFWRAYLNKFFPDVHPKKVKDLMQSWGYEFTEL